MENASKALLIMGGALIGVIVLSIGVMLATSLIDASRTFSDREEAKDLRDFNIRFETYVGREDITAQEIVSVIGVAKQLGDCTNEYVQVILIIDGKKEDVSNKDSTWKMDFLTKYPLTYSRVKDDDGKYSKTEFNYKESLKLLKSKLTNNVKEIIIKLTTLTCDFEIVLINAISEIFKNIFKIGCYFHHKQCLRRKAQKLGLMKNGLMYVR